jgi:hypothetical protein
MQQRCSECQEIHRRELWAKRYNERKNAKTTKKSLEGAVYINGHPQVCTHMKSCFYGSAKEDGCAYAIEEKKTRICNGLYIVDGKCPAYEPKGRKRKRSEPPTFVDMPPKRMKHNYGEV